jgi:hypothetical protein
MIYRVFVNLCTLYEFDVDSMHVSFLHLAVGSVSDVLDVTILVFRLEVCRNIIIYKLKLSS